MEKRQLFYKDYQKTMIIYQQAMREKCRPLLVGFVLIALFVVGSAVKMDQNELAAPIALWVGSALSVYMLFSLCERQYYGGAWLTALFSPVVVVLFASQIQLITRLFSVESMR